MKIHELYTWSLEGFYQYLFANSLHIKRIEAARRTHAEMAKKGIKGK